MWKINSKDNKTYNYTLLTTSEAFYTNLNSKNNFKFKTTQTNINTIYKISNFTKNLNFFNFNIDKNLKISKQKRWLIRNSLLSESMVPNSYLITQSKKLIGNGLLNKDFSSKTLWLPTIMSKLSSLESNIHVKNLQHQLFQTNSDSTLSINNQLIHPYFLNLNFFENSRVWVFKKYFFQNNQCYNLVKGLVNYDLYNNYEHVKNTKHSHSLLFYSYIHFYNLNYLIKNTLTPSLVVKDFLAENSDIVYTNYNHNNNFIKINTPQLDILSGININFFYTFTSNPQPLGTDKTIFFSLLKSPLIHNNSNSYNKHFLNIKYYINK